MDITRLQEFYSGFWLDEPVGNNAFSFEGRGERRLWVAPLVEGNPAKIEPGDHAAFIDIVDGLEVVSGGLKEFIAFDHHNVPGVIFDNHNHAFCFLCAAFQQGALLTGLPLWHVDQHKDTRFPMYDLSLKEAQSLRKVFHYTNYELNVGNFIPPLQMLGFIGSVVQIDSEISFAQEPEGKFILDIDLDVFAPVMDEIVPRDFKMKRIQSWLSKASFITVATSPHFLAQSEAVALARELFAA